MAKVYWAARDLAGSPLGNHQFILVVLGKGENIGIPAQSENGTRFVTLGGFKVAGRLQFQSNNPNDVFSVREVFNPSKHVKWYKPDSDMERHLINTGGRSGLIFAQALVRLAGNFKKNEAKKPLTYALANENCSAWVNSILQAAGISKGARIKAGEFSGIDWGEEDAIPQTYFAP